MKPVRLRPRADRDIDKAVAYLLREHAPEAAGQLLDELEAAFARIGGRPRIGSLRYARILKGLRFWQLPRHPYLVFYVEKPRDVDVLRILHASRDLPAALRSQR